MFRQLPTISTNLEMPTDSRPDSLEMEDIGLSGPDALEGEDTGSKVEQEELVFRLLKHYLKWTELACFSNYENTYNKEKLRQANAKLLGFIEEDDQRLTELTLFKKLNAQNETLLIPLQNIRHFGEKSTFTTSGQPPQVQTFDEKNVLTPPIDHNSSRSTDILLSKSVYAQIVEKYSVIDNTKKFVSQSTLPDDLDQNQLKTWARAAITSFLAAAPRGTKEPTFEDGFSRAELAALMSYCKFNGISYIVGPKQKIRMYSAALQEDPNLASTLDAADWSKLNNNEVISLAADQQDKLLQAITKGEKQGKLQSLEQELGSAYTKDDEWQEWSNKNEEWRIPSQGKNARERLEKEMDRLMQKPSEPLVSIEADESAFPSPIPRTEHRTKPAPSAPPSEEPLISLSGVSQHNHDPSSNHHFSSRASVSPSHKPFASFSALPKQSSNSDSDNEEEDKHPKKKGP